MFRVMVVNGGKSDERDKKDERDNYFLKSDCDGLRKWKAALFYCTSFMRV